MQKKPWNHGMSTIAIEPRSNAQATGCDWDNKKKICRMHTRPVEKGNGDKDSICWSFPNAKYLRLGETGTMGKTSWGSWKKWEYCPNNGRIIAFKMRVDPYNTHNIKNNKKLDNTALNAIKLLCEQDDQSIMSNAGWYGDWTQWKYCPEGEYMVGGQLKSQGSIDMGYFADQINNFFGKVVDGTSGKPTRDLEELAAIDFKMMCSGGGKIIILKLNYQNGKIGKCWNALQPYSVEDLVIIFSYETNRSRTPVFRTPVLCWFMGLSCEMRGGRMGLWAEGKNAGT